MIAPRWWRLAGAIAVVGLLASPVLGRPVLAHAQLVASSPSAGARLESAPDELRLIFSEPLETQLTSLDVTTSAGEPILERVGEVDPSDPFALMLRVPQLTDGVYVVTWRTLSAADGHTAEGFFSFAIGDVAGDLPQAGQPTHTESDPVGVVGRWLAYLGLLLALGMAVFHRLVIRNGPMPMRLVRLLAAGLGLSAAASLVTAVSAGLEAGSIVDYLLGSRNGLLQTARVAVIGAGAGALLLLPRRLAGLAAAVTGLAGMTLLVAAGHAAAIPGPFALISQVVHVAAVGTWAGGVAGLLLLVVRPAWVSEGPPPALQVAVPRFSALALGAIGLVGATGVYAAWVQTGTLLPLGTDYGRTLVIKTTVALVALAIGGLNFFDGGRMRSWLAGFPTRLKVEVAALAAVLFVSALLATTPPVAEATGVGIEPVPDAFGEVAPNVAMQVAPGRPGVNRVTVTTSAAMAAVDGMELSLDRLDTGTTTLVPLVLEGMEGMDHTGGMSHSGATTDADGTIDWIADSIVLPAGSRWDTSVRVLSADGTELSRQRFAFGLSDAGVDEGQGPGLFFAVLTLAGLLAGAGALAIGLGAGGVCLPRCEPLTSRVALLAGGAIAVSLGTVIGIGALVA